MLPAGQIFDASERQEAAAIAARLISDLDGHCSAYPWTEVYRGDAIEAEPSHRRWRRYRGSVDIEPAPPAPPPRIAATERQAERDARAESEAYQKAMRDAQAAHVRQVQRMWDEHFMCRYAYHRQQLEYQAKGDAAAERALMLPLYLEEQKRMERLRRKFAQLGYPNMVIPR